ncbi:DNA polymerase III subunit delta [Candidatus Epulonipiscium viviparus]|uniref:DNA polymerase III subunit delta n=1 Tax=Candidatus Epulonipiscium viviparus TaxID=420336 RepID=UPI0027381256|nr:DNA polymerase III subunit delta [Candidatus Epulopiscium viviparus]
MNECYLIYGNEEYLKTQQIQKLKAATVSDNDVMNFVTFAGPTCNVETIIDEGETLPFFNAKKFILIKESGLFAPGRKDASDRLSDWLKIFPDYICMVFSETQVDKRNKLYKTLITVGSAQEFDFATEAQMFSIINKEFHNPPIEKNVFSYFISRMPKNVGYTLLEFEKLLAYCCHSPITIAAIDKICTITLEQKIFDLFTKIAQQDSTSAITLYHHLVAQKESPIAMLALIATNYRNIFQIKDLARLKHTPYQISHQLGLPIYVVNEMLAVSKVYRYQEIKDALKACLTVDRNVKTGLDEQIRGVELLIIALCIKKPLAAQTI